MTKQWSPVRKGDEYAQSTTEVYVDGPTWAYYYDAAKRLLRRYSVDGAYQEVACRVLLQPFPTLSLVARLNAKFGVARREGTLLVDQSAS